MVVHIFHNDTLQRMRKVERLPIFNEEKVRLT